MFRRLSGGGALAALALLAGCSGGPTYAPVSGVVTLDGVPYAKAVVSFQPVGDEKNPNPGRGSSAYTDANGKFVLMCDGEKDGAVVGKHLVRIMTKGNDVVGQPGVGSDDGGGTAGGKNVDPIPAEWNSLSKVEFEVPAGGTTAANFDIVTKKGKK
jgi:hypothetical protein